MFLSAAGTWQVEIFAKGCHGITEHLYDVLFSKHLVSENVILGQDNYTNPHAQTGFDDYGFGVLVSTQRKETQSKNKMTSKKEIMPQINHVQYIVFL